VAIILFLNKKDVFAEKINKVPIKSHFKEFKGGQDFDKGVEFFKQMFLNRVTDEKRREEIYVHVTCAIDPDSTYSSPLFPLFWTNIGLLPIDIRVVMSAAKEQVFLATLNELGWSG
jgi:G-protein alpha subunit